MIKQLGQGSFWQDLAVGDRFRTWGRTITEADIIGFVGATGMLEVLFVDDTFEVEGGIAPGTRVAPAVLTYALIEGMLCQTMIQGTGLAMLELQKKVLAPARAGDTVHAEVEVTAIRPTSRGNRAVVTSAVTVRNQRGETVMTYAATRLTAGRPADTAAR